MTARREIPNYRFVPVDLGSQVEKSLRATELLNGHFIDVRSQRVSVFAANWQPGQGDFGSVGHTPEKCWVDTGFQIVAYGQPSQVSISIGGRQVSFQCRVLKRSDLESPEITLWAACIDGLWDGIPYDIPYQPPLEHSEDNYNFRNQFRHLLVLSNNRWEFVCNSVLSRPNYAARKQFIRFSTPLTTEWQPALVELVAFAGRWLEPY